jgi:hypothetical protein
VTGNYEAGPIFPGSQGAANLVGWIDRVLLDLRAGRINDARALLESEAWRAMDLSGLPDPIRHQIDGSLQDAAEALANPHGATDSAEESLLIARARLLPGA